MQIAPHLRDGALVVLRSTVYPGTTAYVRQHLAAAGCAVDVAFCPERIAEGHALEELHTLPQIIGADDDAAAERRGGAVPAARHEDDPHDDQGSRARQALHQHLALHEVRGREPVLHDRRTRPASITRTSCVPSARTTRAPADLPGPGFAAGPCLFKDAMQLAAFTSDHFPMGQAAMQVNEGLPAYIVPRSSAATAGSRARPSASSAWHSRPSRTTRAPRSATSCASSSAGPAPGCCATDPYVQDDRLVPLDCVLERERHPGPRRAAQGISRAARRWPGRR